MKDHLIKKAIIPLAGYGSRMYPIIKVLKKSFIPVYGKKTMEPLLINLLFELDEAGVEEIALIVSGGEEQVYRNYFKELDSKIYNKLSEEQQKYEDRLNSILKKITFIEQKEALGFGHAIFLAKEFSNNKPTLVILGDTIYKSNKKDSCTEQIFDTYDKYKIPMISIKEISIDEVEFYGVSKGIFNDNVLTVQRIVEKPSKELTKKELLVDGRIYGNFGQFIINNEIYNVLEEMIDNNNINTNGEIGLTEAFSIYTEKHNIKGVIIDGNSYDLGNIDSYQKYLNENGKK